MRVLVVGATGYLGAAAARALRADGNAIVGIARDNEAGERLSALGYDVARGDVAEPERLVEAANRCDGVLFVVQLQRDDAVEVERAALRALADALAGTSKAFVYTSGAWYYGATGDRIADETSPANPPPTLAARPGFERIVLGAGARGIVVRPGDVYGEGKGLPALFAQTAREYGAARTIGDGSNRWPVVHVDDLAQLYAAVFARAVPGDIFNANDETAFTQREIAQAASRGAGRGGASVEWPVAQAVEALGPWSAALAMDQRITSARARERLGWSTRSTTILDDLERGSYVT